MEQLIIPVLIMRALLRGLVEMYWVMTYFSPYFIKNHPKLDIGRAMISTL